MVFNLSGNSLSNTPDVVFSNPTAGDVIVYDVTVQKWRNNPALRSTDANAYYAGSAYPTRSSVTPDTQRRVRWIGPTAPTIGGNYAISGLDVWEKTS